jgi:hypothetical protein
MDDMELLFRRRRGTCLPRIVATCKVGFQRCRDLRMAVFAEVLSRFTAGPICAAPP